MVWVKKNWKIYVVFIVAYLLTLYIVRVSAYQSLELCRATPEITENSFFIKVFTNR